MCTELTESETEQLRTLIHFYHVQDPRACYAQFQSSESCLVALQQLHACLQREEASEDGTGRYLLLLLLLLLVLVACSPSHYSYRLL